MTSNCDKRSEPWQGQPCSRLTSIHREIGMLQGYEILQTGDLSVILGKAQHITRRRNIRCFYHSQKQQQTVYHKIIINNETMRVPSVGLTRFYEFCLRSLEDITWWKHRFVWRKQEVEGLNPTYNKCLLITLIIKKKLLSKKKGVSCIMEKKLEN